MVMYSRAVYILGRFQGLCCMDCFHLGTVSVFMYSRSVFIWDGFRGYVFQGCLHLRTVSGFMYSWTVFISGRFQCLGIQRLSLSWKGFVVGLRDRQNLGTVSVFIFSFINLFVYSIVVGLSFVNSLPM